MMDLVVGVFATVILAPFAYQLLMENAEKIALWLVNRTADRQPPDLREARRAEWVADILFTKGSASQIVYAFGVTARYYFSVPFSVPKVSMQSLALRITINFRRDLALMVLPAIVVGSMIATGLAALVGVNLTGWVAVLKSYGQVAIIPFFLLSVFNLVVLLRLLRRPPPIVRDDTPPNDDV